MFEYLALIWERYRPSHQTLKVNECISQNVKPFQRVELDGWCCFVRYLGWNTSPFLYLLYSHLRSHVFQNKNNTLPSSYWHHNIEIPFAEEELWELKIDLSVPKVQSEIRSLFSSEQLTIFYFLFLYSCSVLSFHFIWSLLNYFCYYEDSFSLKGSIKFLSCQTPYKTGFSQTAGSCHCNLFLRSCWWAHVNQSFRITWLLIEHWPTRRSVCIFLYNDYTAD